MSDMLELLQTCYEWQEKDVKDEKKKCEAMDTICLKWKTV